TGLPLIVHTRDADEATAAVLAEEYAKGPFKGVLHCFTGGAALARAALDIGFAISFSGIVTFKKSEALRAIAADVPAGRLLVETDAPYLAPHPHRGKPNEPAYVRHTLACLAEVRGVDEAVLEAETTDAFFALFSKAERPQ
ncbi:MAG: TatD family hydrolase, partial [Pseudomonadota bacterium]